MLNRSHSPSTARRHLLASRAQGFRHSPSEPERRLWSELSGKRLGVAFRRQVVLGDAIADFYAPTLRLVVEVDGAQHRLRRTADARRDRELRRLGCRVLRLDAELVLGALPVAVQLIREAIHG
jgi:very-short-patch-repair endonuclease